MAQAGFDDWFQYRQDDQNVLVSPPITQRTTPEWTGRCMSALGRPALGLLPSNARYVLARDESVRLELITGSVDATC
jgi:hypothetical protein